MRRFSFLAVCFLCIIFHANAQKQTPKEGRAQFGISDPNQIDLMMKVLPNVSGNTRDLLTFQSVKANMMPVRDAGRKGADFSYILASCLEYYYNLGNNFKVNLSPDYITLHLTGPGKPLSFVSAFRFLADDGTVSAAILPYGSTELNQGVNATQRYKIRNYLHIFQASTRGRQKGFEVRKALMRGHPVIVEVLANESIYGFTSGEKYLESGGSGDKTFPLTVVGFDETLEAFEVMSCWGRNWGNNGYIWIRYDDFEQLAQNGYVLAPDIDL